MRILKYPLGFGRNTVKSYPGHVLELKHIGFQNSLLYGWFAEYPVEDKDEHSEEIYVAMTGETIPDGFSWYMGTAIHEYPTHTSQKGYYVVHAWQ